MKKINTRLNCYIPIEISQYKNPVFNIESGVLLDISLEGFKIELNGDTTMISKDSVYWLNIPLYFLNDKSLDDDKIKLKVICKWIEIKSLRCGGQFIGLSNLNKDIIQKLISGIG